MEIMFRPPEAGRAETMFGWLLIVFVIVLVIDYALY